MKRNLDQNFPARMFGLPDVFHRKNLAQTSTGIQTHETFLISLDHL
jgi:hypothetical protein